MESPLAPSSPGPHLPPNPTLEVAEPPAPAAPPPATPPPAAAPPSASTALDALGGVLLDVSVRLGTCEMPLSQVARLREGSVLELDTSAGDPLVVLVNGRPVAEGEPVVLEGQLGLRITRLLGG